MLIRIRSQIYFYMTNLRLFQYQLYLFSLSSMMKCLIIVLETISSLKGNWYLVKYWICNPGLEDQINQITPPPPFSWGGGVILRIWWKTDGQATSISSSFWDFRRALSPVSCGLLSTRRALLLYKVYMALVPFWFPAERHWRELVTFWFSADDMFQN